MIIKIKQSKNVPEKGSGRRLKYPFDKMVVGKYLELPTRTQKQITKFYSVFTAARRYATRQSPPWKFASRLTDDIGTIHRIK